MRVRRRLVQFSFYAAPFVVAGFIWPEAAVNPIPGAKPSSWNKKAYWNEAWGADGVHKGLDIYTPRGTTVVSATQGFVVSSGETPLAGKFVVILGPKWRLHSYGHLDAIAVEQFKFVKHGTPIGTVGDTGLAKGQANRLHYAVITMVPYITRWDKDATQGWKKIFYLNPTEVLVY